MHPIQSLNDGGVKVEGLIGSDLLGFLPGDVGNLIKALVVTVEITYF